MYSRACGLHFSSSSQNFWVKNAPVTLFPTCCHCSAQRAYVAFATSAPFSDYLFVIAWLRWEVHTMYTIFSRRLRILFLAVSISKDRSVFYQNIELLCVERSRSTVRADISYKYMDLYNLLRTVWLWGEHVANISISVCIEAPKNPSGLASDGCPYLDRVFVSVGHGTARVADVAFVSKAPASDSSLLFASCGCEGSGIVKLWNRNSFECLADLQGHTARTAQVAFHPHENLLVSTRCGDVPVWSSLAFFPILF